MKVYRFGEHVVANARAIWTEAMYEAGIANAAVIAMTGDLSRSLCTEKFRTLIPERYLNIGIAEQNMVSIAAGLALCGKIPIAPVTRRFYLCELQSNLEQMSAI